jgi:ligand-binding sensor domain-containing protein
MKRYFLYVAALFFTLFGCVNQPVEIQDSNVITQVLDSCLVSAIKFDNSGNAWIGTFQKGLIKYSNGRAEYLNSLYPVLPTTIVDIQIDSKGNIWMGYGQGIIKYDGTTFTKYNASNSPLPDNPVNSIAIDQNDNVWFTSCRFKTGGFGKFDGTNWTLYTPDNSALPVNFVQSIAVDKQNNIWLAVSQIVNECYLVKIAGNSWTVYDKNAFGFTPYYFSKIAVNSSNEVFCGIDYSLASTMANPGAGILKYDGKNFERIDMDDFFIVKNVKTDKADKIWCGDWAGKMRYGVFTGQTWIYQELSQTLSGIFAIEQAPDGKIWLGTSNGIHIVPGNVANVSN